MSDTADFSDKEVADAFRYFDVKDTQWGKSHPITMDTPWRDPAPLWNRCDEVLKQRNGRSLIALVEAVIEEIDVSPWDVIRQIAGVPHDTILKEEPENGGK